MTRLLRIEAPHFVAGAIFEKSADGWGITRTAPILAWLRKMRVAEVPAYLDRKGWSYEWTGTP